MARKLYARKHVFYKYFSRQMAHNSFGVVISPPLKSCYFGQKKELNSHCPPKTPALLTQRMLSVRELFLYKNPSKEPSLTLTCAFPLKSFKALQQLSHLNHQQASVSTSRHSPCSGGTEARGSTWSSATPQPKPRNFASQSSASATQPLLCPDRAVLWGNCTPTPALEAC